MFLKFGGFEVMGVPEADVDRTSASGKASAVQFIHFPFTDEQIAAFRAPDAQVIIGFKQHLEREAAGGGAWKDKPACVNEESVAASRASATEELALADLRAEGRHEATPLVERRATKDSRVVGENAGKRFRPARQAPLRYGHARLRRGPPQGVAARLFLGPCIVLKHKHGPRRGPWNRSKVQCWKIVCGALGLRTNAIDCLKW